jgi:site-specific DNA recombinase
MSQAPYGYTYVSKTEACPGRLIINETEAEVVRHLFHWLVDEQLSTYQMTKRINETGWRTRKGNTRWSAGYIRNLLGNSVYRGIYYYNKRKLVQATRRNMPAQGPLKPRRTGRVVRPKEEWIAIEVPAIVDPETWELAQQQLRLNRERSPRNTKKHAYLLQSLLICSYCQVRMLGHTTGRPQKPNRRYLCGRKDSLKGHPIRCPARTFSADMLEELVWASVSSLLQDPKLLLEQYQLRQEPRYGTPQQHEQNRLERRQKALTREEERLIDAYQAGVMDLDALTERCWRLRDERARVVDRLSQLQHQQLEQAQHDILGQTLEEFCCKMSDVLDNPSFETKQRILQLVVDKILVSDEEVTIQHTVPISDVRLWRDHYSRRGPIRGALPPLAVLHPRSACGARQGPDQWETTTKRRARSSVTPIRRERVICSAEADAGTATQRRCPCVTSHPFSAKSMANARHRFPGPCARVAKRSVPRRRCITSRPRSGRMARSSTALGTPSPSVTRLQQ